MHIELLPIPPSELGESPFWHPDEQRLYWCDIQAHGIRAWTPGSGELQAWPMPSEPGCCAPAPGGKLVIGLRDGMYLLDTRSSNLQCLTPLPHDTSVLRLNDGRCDTAGRFVALAGHSAGLPSAAHGGRQPDRQWPGFQPGQPLDVLGTHWRAPH
jgi:sugar lactone lactonase YvrE